MKSLYNFIFEDDSDNSVYYKLGLHKYKWASSQLVMKKRTDRKYNIHGSHKRQGILQFAKDTLKEILPDKEEIIHRAKWDLDGILGETEKQLMHPDYWTMAEYILSKFKRKHDILTLFECSNSKPYSASNTIKTRFLDKFSSFSDFACISNPGIIPMEYSHFYPYRYDEWNHFEEKDDIAEKYVRVNSSRFMHYVKSMGYKHVIVIMQHPSPQRALTWLRDNDINGCKKWLTILIEDPFRSNLIEKLKRKFMNTGLSVMRMLGSRDVYEKYVSKLKSLLDESEKSKFDELLEILDKKGKTKQEELKQFNKENNGLDIDYTKGTSDTFKSLTESDVDAGMVSKYTKFVKKFEDDLAQRIKSVGDSKEYHKNRIYFTVLDLLLEYHKNQDIIDDPDGKYWSMKAAIDKNKSKDLINVHDYVYYYKSSLDELGITEEDIIKESDKLGITQTKDDRKNFEI